MNTVRALAQRFGNYRVTDVVDTAAGPAVRVDLPLSGLSCIVAASGGQPRFRWAFREPRS